MTGEELKALREEAGLSQAELGKAADLGKTDESGRAMIAAYESGARAIPRWRVTLFHAIVSAHKQKQATG